MIYRLLSLLCAAFIISACNGNAGEIAGAIAKATGNEEEEADQIASAADKLARAIDGYTYEEQVVLGEGVAIKSFQTQGELHSNQELQRYVNLVGKTIVDQISDKPIPYSFAVVINETPNAWAGPGGFIFITTGLLKKMEDEAELAGVLAHEIAHVEQGHMIKMLRRGNFFQGISDIGSASSDDMKKYSDTVSEAQAILFEKGLDRGMETEADALGVEIATVAGYDPSGLKRILQKLDSGSSGGGWLSSTHPSISNRIRRIDDLLNGELEGFSGVVQRERFQKYTANKL